MISHDHKMKFDRAFVTLLSTEDYLPGVLVLWKSLIKTGTKFQLIVAITSSISREMEHFFEEIGLRVCRIEDVKVDSFFENVNKNRKDHWNNTFAKISIFDIKDFKKVVYIDSDMLIVNNIDELFDFPNLSAASAGLSFPGNEHWTGLNSGLMVIEPNSAMKKLLVSCMEEMIDRPDLAGDDSGFGDQDVLNYCYRDWPNIGHRLGEEYNIFFTYIDFYMAHNRKALGGRSAKVIHYVGKVKPWNRSIFQHIKYIFSSALSRRKFEVFFYIKYLCILYGVKNTYRI